MAKVKENTLLKCPICKKKLWLTNVIGHRELKHAELTHKEFEALLVEGIKSGKIKAKVFEPPAPGLESGTQKLLRSKMRGSSGIKSIVQGGRTSPN